MDHPRTPEDRPHRLSLAEYVVYKYRGGCLPPHRSSLSTDQPSRSGTLTSRMMRSYSTVVSSNKPFFAVNTDIDDKVLLGQSCLQMGRSFLFVLDNQDAHQ
jgi:hypothetical protein